MQEGSLISVRLARLSLINNLFLDNNQRKNCTLGGMVIFQTKLTNCRTTLFWLTTAYKYCTKYLHVDVKLHKIWSSSPQRELDSIRLYNSYQRFIVLAETFLLKVNIRFSPSKTSWIVFPCLSLIMYKGQYAIAKCRIFGSLGWPGGWIGLST